MNSTTNPTFILENANYIFGRFFDGFENVYCGEQRKRIGSLYVKSHRIGNLNQFKVDADYPDADVRTDIFKAITQFVNECEDAEMFMNEESDDNWVPEVMDILCDEDGEFNYQLNEEWVNPYEVSIAEGGFKN